MDVSDGVHAVQGENGTYSIKKKKSRVDARKSSQIHLESRKVPTVFMCGHVLVLIRDGR